MKTALIALAVCAAYLLTACGGSNEPIDEGCPSAHQPADGMQAKIPAPCRDASI